MYFVGARVLKIVGDTAFNVVDPDCLALRGLIAGIGNANCKVFNTIDFWSRKQTRLCRSTFVAETHNLSEAAEEGMLLAGFWQEGFVLRSLLISEFVINVGTL